MISTCGSALVTERATVGKVWIAQRTDDGITTTYSLHLGGLEDER
jgi:hypothetical protein